MNLLGYNREKNERKVVKIQKILDSMYRECICKIELPGIEVVPVQLSKVLDSQDASHYENRVEPSVLGGMLMGQHFFTLLSNGCLDE